MATAAAKRYGRAVFEVATEENGIDRWLSQLATLRDVMSQPSIASVLSNPTIPVRDRMGLISADEGFEPEVVNLARLLIESNRVNEIAGVVEQFRDLADDAAGRVRAVVTTAIELPAAEQDELAKKLGERLGKDVALRAHVDPRVLGGLKLQYGDRLIDATIATRLQQLRSRLIES
ncbi:MAG TPA: F0F1 ATP synthase subunit delta [Candidatus Dormibacteraeota bacterium]|nr:F0F1 ATP synthase subunit delta [Candidatus Dormibacteraeota bacterium]